LDAAIGHSTIKSKVDIHSLKQFGWHEESARMFKTKYFQM